MLHILEKLQASIFLTDGGLETDLIFNKGIDLPHFAAFPLIENPKYQETFESYYREYMDMAKKHQTGYILESPTWRANPDWGFKLGYSKDDLIRVNKLAIQQMNSLRATYKKDIETIFISGQLGPRRDGYQIRNAMSVKEAEGYHKLQMSVFKNEKVDLVSAITMTYSNEALGITKAAKANNLPVVLSFTVETDGHLPSGESLKEAIEKIDKATKTYPLYYMINCAHPTHFMDKVETSSNWKCRIKGIRANASCKSHAELDESTELDIGNPKELGQLHKTLKTHLPELAIFGGCCGTDASHVASICNHVLA
ncbi:homocysteine S-methyltransferase family protein [Seonamhaeicola maritimus]|uniref:homocysteine S-methyltransferase family protein n=1 Tax=Seonamhaeicola maritimus TaxID=2591822 RepID=UPI00249451F2|nr:homocysteine S-methyltransferase family protein [Seonamhaeicola maritimus]